MGIEHDAVTANGHQNVVSIQLGEHMLIGVVGIQGHQHPIDSRFDK